MVDDELHPAVPIQISHGDASTLILPSKPSRNQVGARPGGNISLRINALPDAVISMIVSGRIVYVKYH